MNLFRPFLYTKNPMPLIQVQDYSNSRNIDMKLYSINFHHLQEYFTLHFSNLK